MCNDDDDDSDDWSQGNTFTINNSIKLEKKKKTCKFNTSDK